jgi:hypothetical protein
VTTIGTDYSFRSGHVSDGSAQPLTFVGAQNAQGYGMSMGTGYNEVGFVNNIYQINCTGIGPRNATREVEVQVTYGPVAR